MSGISSLTADLRLHTAGILAYPPKMAEDIGAWVRRQYATYAAFNSADLIDFYRERIAETEGERKRDAEKSLKDHEALLRLAKQEGARGKPKKITRKKFKVDLSGLPANYPKVSSFSDITVVTEITLDKEINGTWHRDKKALTVKFTGRPPINVAEFAHGIKRINGTLMHELRHMVQDIMYAYQIDLVDKMLQAQGRSMEDLSDKEVERLRKMVTRGNPKEYESWSYEGLKGKEQYFLDPQEFFTWLGQAEEEFLTEIRTNRPYEQQKEHEGDPDWDPRPTKEEFDRFVGNPKVIERKGLIHRVGDPISTHPFFAALHKHDRKRWQRAVKELWKRVQGKLSRKANDLVFRYLTADYSFGGPKAPDFDRAYQKYKQSYEKAYREVTQAFPNLAEAAKLKYPPHYTSIFDVYIHGRDLANAALKGKEIPSSKIKAFESAYKVFNRTRRVKDYVPWFAKNIKAIQILLESNSWPDKGTDEERTKSVGPFTVVNQVGSDIAASEKMLTNAADLIRRSGVPGASKTLYGEVFIVGSISRKHSTAALYQPSSDTVYLLLLKRFSGKHTFALIHEFGHRLWTKFMSASVKANWKAHHESIGRKTVDITFPAVGEPVEGVRGNPKVERYEGTKIYLEGGGYITTKQFENFMESQGKAKRFPTPYSSTDAEEHFCDAFALYCQGSLKEPHKSDFEAVVVKG